MLPLEFFLFLALGYALDSSIEIGSTGEKLNPDIKINEELPIHVNITNDGSSTIDDLAVSLIAPGFIITQSSNFPDTLYPNSKIEGFFTLKASMVGKTKMWLLTTFTQDTQHQNQLKFQSSSISDPLYVTIIDDMFIQFDRIWQGFITTILGAIMGTFIPIIYNRLNKNKLIENERDSAIKKVKSLLEYELDFNKTRISQSKKCALTNWNKILNEYYYLLSENEKLSDALLELYLSLEDYNIIDNPFQREKIKKKEYIEKIDQIEKLIRKWNTSKSI